MDSSFFIKHPGRSAAWTAYISGLRPECLPLGAALVAILLTAATLFQSKSSDGLYSFVLCSLLLNREVQTAVRSPSQRVFAWTALAAGFLLFSSYCAVFIANLTVSKIDWPFNSEEELLQSNFKVIKICPAQGP